VNVVYGANCMKLQWQFRVLLLALYVLLWSALPALAIDDPLPSWNEGHARQAILDFVHATTDRNSSNFVPVEERLATFDLDGTLWCEQPLYTEYQFSLDQVVAMAPQHPEWKDTEPFKTVLSGDRAGISTLTTHDWEKIVVTAQAGVTVGTLSQTVKQWLSTTKHPRFHCQYTKLSYQPMLEMINYLRSNGYHVYICTGSSQDFVRCFATAMLGFQPEQVIGSSIKGKFTVDSAGKPEITKEPKLWLDNNYAGKAEDIYLFTGRRPQASIGNTPGDEQMLQYAGGGSGARLMMLVLHDDAVREYAYGPATGLPDTKVGAFPQRLYDEAMTKGWTVISPKKDWKKVFADQPAN